MAANYNIVTQYPGTDILGGTRTQDVVFIGATTVPHATYFETYVVAQDYTATAATLAAESWANAIEEVWAHAGVIGVQWTQIVNDSDQLVPSVVVTVGSDSGQSAAQVTIPMVNLPANAYGGQIQNLRSELNAAEAA